MAQPVSDVGAAPRSYNILSLDGGGTWAILQAMALADLYGAETPGRAILQTFQLVVANSGGSLTAAGLMADMTPAALIAEFSSDSVRRQVFTRLSWLETFPRSAIPGFRLGPKYRTSAKLGALTAILDRYDPGLAQQPIQTLPWRMAQRGVSVPHLLLLAYDYDTNRAKFLRTNLRSHAGAQKFRAARAAGAPEYDTTLAEAVHASTNAPVNFFDAPAEISHSGQPIRTWDGAIAGYNNPILAGITEALANGVNRKTIRILSLGTGSVVLPQPGGPFTPAHPWLVAQRETPGLLRDLEKLSLSILENPPDVATYMAHMMIDDQLDYLRAERWDDPVRQETRIVRFNPLLQPIVRPGTEIFDVPGAHSRHPARLSPDEFMRLMQLDLDAVEDLDVALIQRFGRLWIDEWVNNQPILADATKVESELGQRWYSQGRKQARKLGLAPPPDPAKAAAEAQIVDDKHALEEAMRQAAQGGRSAARDTVPA
jgi:hypothetical protein